MLDFDNDLFNRLLLNQQCDSNKRYNDCITMLKYFKIYETMICLVYK